MDSAFGRIPVEVGSWGFLCGAVMAGLLSLAAARGWLGGRSRGVGVAILGVLGAILLVLVPDSQLLVLLAYAPIFLVGAPFGWPPVSYFDEVTWTGVFQLLSVGGGLLLAATALAWRRRARHACMSCGRTETPAHWTSAKAAASWGRWATVVAVIVPSVYAINRLAWVAGIPLGISQDFLDELRSADLIWAAFGLGTFAAIFVTSASVPLVVGLATMQQADDGLGWLQTLLAGDFPLWGLALAAATLAYHFRRRGACDTCHGG